MRKRIAALAAIALGAGLLSAAPASAATQKTCVPYSVSADKTQAVYDYNADADAEETVTFTVLTYCTAKLVDVATPAVITAKGTLTLSGAALTSSWADADAAEDRQGASFGDDFTTTSEDDSILSSSKQEYEFLIGENSDGEYTIVVKFNKASAVGTYSAAVKFGTLSAAFTANVVDIKDDTTSTLSSIVVGSKAVAGVGQSVTATVTSRSGKASMLTTSGAGSTLVFNSSAELANFTGSSALGTTAAAIVSGDVTGDVKVLTPYTGDVTLSLFLKGSSGYSSTPYLTIKIPVAGTATAPADPIVTTNTNVAALQAQVTSLTSTVTSIQTSIAALVASTTATLTTLSGQIAKIMKKLKIK